MIYGRVKVIYTMDTMRYRWPAIFCFMCSQRSYINEGDTCRKCKYFVCNSCYETEEDGGCPSCKEIDLCEAEENRLRNEVVHHYGSSDEERYHTPNNSDEDVEVGIRGTQGCHHDNARGTQECHHDGARSGTTIYIGKKTSITNDVYQKREKMNDDVEIKQKDE